MLKVDILLRFLIILNLCRTCITRCKAAIITGRNIRIVLVGAVASHNLEVVVLRVCTLRVRLHSIRSSLIGLQILLFKLSMEASLVIVTTLARVVVILGGVYLLVIPAMVVIPGKPDLPGLLQYWGHVIVMEPLAIS